MATRFGQIFWGLLLLLLDFNINGFDILPDFLGCALVAVGCSGLAPLSRRFPSAGMLGWLLMVLALVGYVMPNGFATIFGLVWLIIDCSMMWLLLGGVMEAASARQRPDLSRDATNQRIAYVALMILSTVIGWAGDGMKEAGIAIGILSMICILIVLFLILQLIFRMRNLDWNEPLSPSWDPEAHGNSDA